MAYLNDLWWKDPWREWETYAILKLSYWGILAQIFKQEGNLNLVFQILSEFKMISYRLKLPRAVCLTTLYIPIFLSRKMGKSSSNHPEYFSLTEWLRGYFSCNQILYLGLEKLQTIILPPTFTLRIRKYLAVFWFLQKKKKNSLLTFFQEAKSGKIKFNGNEIFFSWERRNGFFNKLYHKHTVTL